MKKQILQVGENGADIEMHVSKTEKFYFVGFCLFIKKEGKRVPETPDITIRPFNNIEEIEKEFSEFMNGKKITI